ncbi:MAG: hypothetical protein KC766_36860, partial [Myxococcales bacterium]|nr:hypothetical protein [Myxococcales bacterium]
MTQDRVWVADAEAGVIEVYDDALSVERVLGGFEVSFSARLELEARLRVIAAEATVKLGSPGTVGDRVPLVHIDPAPFVMSRHTADLKVRMSLTEEFLAEHEHRRQERRGPDVELQVTMRFAVVAANDPLRTGYAEVRVRQDAAAW